MPRTAITRPRFGLRSPLHPEPGQSLVETALVLPILLLLLVFAIDFGRLFFGWVALTNASRVGANYAAAHPAPGFDAADYALLIGQEDVDDYGDRTINCEPQAAGLPEYTTPDGTPTTTPQVGDYATVTLHCDFTPITPLVQATLGTASIELTAVSTFPVRNGCLNCPSPSPAPIADPPEECRTVPMLAGLSVAGARAAWVSAGFFADRFTPETGDDTLTVEAATVNQDDPLSQCTGSEAIFSSYVTVTTATPDPTDGTCLTVPNVTGVTVAEGRDAWVAAGFDAADFSPPDQDTLRILSQETAPDASTPGVSCIDPDSTITVVTGEPWADPPPAPCRVPNLIDEQRSAAQAIWEAAGFTTIVQPTNGNWRIKWQSLVGGDWVSCDSVITVDNK